MSAHSLARAEAVVQLLGHLLPQDFGHGAPACSPRNADLFWPEDDDPAYEEKIEAAKQICAACPIKASCLEQALRTRAQGVMAGTTTDERRRMVRSARRRANYAANRAVTQVTAVAS